jgi:rhomboid family GlyGly-CTERM serine protease
MNIRSVLTALNKQGLSLYLILLGCLFLGPWNPTGADLFELDRSELKDGEYWRFWTGQLVHLSWQHLLISAAGLIILQQLFGKELNIVVWLWGFAVISLVVGVCMLAFSRFGSFVGLSALLHGLFAYGAILAMRRDGLLAWGVLIVVGAKIIWEQIQGGSIWMQDFIGLPVATDAHLYGFAAGLVLGAVMVAAGSRNSD